MTHWMKYDMMSDCWRAWNPLCNARRRISSLSPRKGVSADASLVCHESPGGGGGKALFLMDSREGLWQYDVRAGVLNDITPRDSKFHRPVELKCCNEKYVSTVLSAAALWNSVMDYEMHVCSPLSINQ